MDKVHILNNYNLLRKEIFIMRIGMVLEGVFPPDIRVEKESRRLIDCGHEVFLLSAWKEGLLKEDKIDGVQITGLLQIIV